MKPLFAPYFPLLGFLFAFLGQATAQTGELRAVVLPVADTSLYEVVPTNNLGRSLAVPVGVHSGTKRSRYLLRFDPASALPIGARVTRVTLELQVTVAGTLGWDYGVHRMLREWEEGCEEGGNGSGAIAGETTWLAQFHPAGLWAAPGGSNGADYATIPSHTVTLGGTGSTNCLSSPELAADVQLWLDQPQLNFGWMIRASDETVSQTVRRIASRESPVGGPVLVVHYLPPDSDGDGVPDSEDQCPGTAPGVLVDAAGCSLEQIVPCEATWTSHGQYVAALAAATEQFVRAGLLTPQQRAAALRAGAQSDCGR